MGSSRGNSATVDTQSYNLSVQIPNKQIQYAVVFIGDNDFGPGSPAYNGIYSGTWTPTQISNYANQVVTNIRAAVNGLLPTGVKIVVATVPDYGVTPLVQQSYPDAAQRQLVYDVIANQVNPAVEQFAQADHLVVADVLGLLTAGIGTDIDPKTTLTIGDVPIDLTQMATGNPSPAGFCSDGEPNSAIKGVLANLFAQALDTGYGAGHTAVVGKPDTRQPRAVVRGPAIRWPNCTDPTRTTLSMMRRNPRHGR